jgi:hypothetical protein
MKAGGARQGDMMNKGGGAGAALENAAKEAIPGGKGFGGNGPGSGDENKSPGYAKPDGNKTLGESLAYLKMKKEMEKALDLKWKKKAWYEFERQKMIEESIIKSAIENLLGKGLFEPMGKAMGDLFGNLTGGGSNTLACVSPEGNPFTYDKGKIDGKTIILDKDGYLYNGSVKMGKCSDKGSSTNSAPAGQGGTETPPGSVDNTGGGGALSPDNSGGYGNIGSGLVTSSQKLTGLRQNLDAINADMLAAYTTCGGASGKKVDASVSDGYCAAVKVMKPQMDSYQSAITHVAKAGEKIKTAREQLGNGIVAAQAELDGKSGGLTGINTKLGTSLTQFTAARDALKQNEENPKGKFKLDEKATKAFNEGKKALEDTKTAVSGVESAIPALNQGISQATTALEGENDSSKKHLATANSVLTSPKATAAIPAVSADDRLSAPAGSFAKVLGESKTGVTEQYQAMNKLQGMAVRVKEELVDARDKTQAYSVANNGVKEKKIVNGEGSERKAADPNVKGAVGDSVTSIVEAASLTKGQFTLPAEGATSENPILGAALDMWKTNVTVPCAAGCGPDKLKQAVAAYNTALAGTEVLDKLTKDNEAAKNSYSAAKESANKVGASAKSLTQE